MIKKKKSNSVSSKELERFVASPKGLKVKKPKKKK